VNLAARISSGGQRITPGIRRSDGLIRWRHIVRAETQGRFHPLDHPFTSAPAGDMDAGAPTR